MAHHLHPPRCHLQDAQRVVQHRLGVGDVVSDGEREAAHVGLEQQARLRVGVICITQHEKRGDLVSSTWGQKKTFQKDCTVLIIKLDSKEQGQSRG